jgi:short-subunit dehydrogenase
MKKAIIVGASSGIGRALARLLARNGYAVGLVARRLPLLLALQQEIGNTAFVKQIDVSNTLDAMSRFSEMVQEMEDVDLVVMSAGTGFINPGLDWDKENETIAVNVAGFAAIANIAMRYFLEKGSGHLVNISSIAALRGNGSAPAYNASKAFESIYVEGLRQKVAKLRLPITITDIQPGFVDTAMAQSERLFWVASPEKAAKQIYRAIQGKRKHAYITRRWRLIAWLVKLMPDSVYHRF